MTYEAWIFYCTNSQTIGRVGKVATRAWQIADKMEKDDRQIKERKRIQ
jgi:urease alpha subunit